MTSLLSVHEFRFGATGAALSFSLRAGQLMAVFGEAGAGKTRFIRSLCGLERSYRGSVRLGADVALAGYPQPTRRLTPETLARRAAGRSGASRAAEALAATRLWDDRRAPFGNLSPSAQTAAELLQVLATPAQLLLIDGQWDLLDPWARASVQELTAHRLAQGAAVIFSTQLPSMAPTSDLLVVWKRSGLAYAGTYADLEQQYGVHDFEIETLNNASVRALCEPFEVDARAEKGVVRLRAKEGQPIASRLLLEGYGDIRAIIHGAPSPEEVLSSL